MKIEAKDIVVVIPLYKKMISNFELQSLIQCDDVLNGRYDIKFICPNRIDFKYYGDIISQVIKHSKCEFLTFEDFNFESRLSYSYLLTSKNFYRRFSNYKYMLIYQLDAWVFKDELLEWCEKGYDYIGSPWCHMCLKCVKDEKNTSFSNNFIGNGGLSLRNIKSFIDNLPYESETDGKYLDSIPEDIYISLINNFKTPSCDEASKFSIEVLPRMQLSKFNENSMPFGFHNLMAYDKILHDELIEKTFTRKEGFKENGSN